MKQRQIVFKTHKRRRYISCNKRKTQSTLTYCRLYYKCPAVNSKVFEKKFHRFLTLILNYQTIVTTVIYSFGTIRKPIAAIIITMPSITRICVKVIKLIF